MSATRTRQHIRESRFWQTYQRHRYIILFYALLLTMIVMPIATAIGLPAVLIRILLAVCLFAALMPSATRHTRAALFSATLLLVVARSLSESGRVPVNSGLVLAVVSFAGLAAAGAALRFAIASKTVDAETVYAALSTYLLAGIFFGEVYFSIEQIRPASFVGPDAFTEPVGIYYSFVTLATLGYGDYLPRTDIARGVATLEVIGGQLFLAVLVARLIGAFETSERRG